MRGAHGAAAPAHATRRCVDARKAIVLLNRRGWSNFLTCRSCGHVWSARSATSRSSCTARERPLACHHCGHRERVPRALPGVRLGRRSPATARAPSASSTSCTALGVRGVPPRRRRRSDAGARCSQRFQAAPTAACCVGTQMVAKGHDFPDVDARRRARRRRARCASPTSAPRSARSRWSTQLAGRAGRGSAGGRVLVQTIAPDAPSIRLAARHDADGFLAERAAPPRGAALPAVLDADPDRLLGVRGAAAPRTPRAAATGRGLGPRRARARRRCSACAGRERARSSSRRASARRRSRDGRRRGRRRSRPTAARAA